MNGQVIGDDIDAVRWAAAVAVAAALAGRHDAALEILDLLEDYPGVGRVTTICRHLRHLHPSRAGSLDRLAQTARSADPELAAAMALMLAIAGRTDDTRAVVARLAQTSADRGVPHEVMMHLEQIASGAAAAHTWE